MINDIINNIFNKYNLSKLDKDNIMKIINSLIIHPEFQKRLTNDFCHHGTITLGEHILDDVITTYFMAKNSKRKINVDLAVKIALFHDLYTVPWQSSSKAKKEKCFFNKHGFRHPIEAVINAYNWYPNEFNNLEECKIIIDGIIHHMYPLPVTKFNNSDYNVLELKNFELLSNIPDNIKKIIFDSTKRKGLKKISICKSKYIEGRIMAKADKIVSVKQFKDLDSILAIVSGVNKKVKGK